MSTDKGCNLLISLGFDGRILLWKLNSEGKTDLVLLQIFSVFVQDLPKGLAVPASASRKKTQEEVVSEVGISCSAINYKDSSFVVGCVGGAIFLCSFDVTSSIPCQDRRSLLSGKTRIKTSSSPIKMTYTPHRSNLQSLDFSLHDRSIFLSCDAEGELRVYNVLESRPISVLHLNSGVTTCFWSMVKNGLIYCLKSSGSLVTLKFFEEDDLFDEKSRSHAHSEGRLTLSCPIMTLQCNAIYHLLSNKKNMPSNHEQVAVVTSSGDLNIYDMSD